MLSSVGKVSYSNIYQAYMAAMAAEQASVLIPAAKNPLMGQCYSYLLAVSSCGISRNVIIPYHVWHSWDWTNLIIPGQFHPLFIRISLTNRRPDYEWICHSGWFLPYGGFTHANAGFPKKWRWFISFISWSIPSREWKMTGGSTLGRNVPPSWRNGHQKIGPFLLGPPGWHLRLNIHGARCRFCGGFSGIAQIYTLSRETSQGMVWKKYVSLEHASWHIWKV